MIRKLENMFDAMIHAMSWMSDVILIFIMVSVCMDVVMRYFFNRPTSWVIEISEYLLLYMTFLGAAWVLKQEGHVTVDILMMRVSPRARAKMEAAGSLVGVFVCLILVWFGTIETWDNFERGVRNPSILEFPKTPLLAIIPFGSFLFMIQFIRRTFKFLRDLKASE